MTATVTEPVVYEKLNMDGKAVGMGSFVKTLRGAVGVGFEKGTHVHKDWWSKTLDYDQGMKYLQHNAESREDIMAKAKEVDFRVTDEGRFVFIVQGREFSPTLWALNTFSTRSDLIAWSSTFLQKLAEQEDYDRQDAETMVSVAKNAIRRTDPNKVFRVRTYNDGTMRAFLTDKYSPVDNRWYLETLRKLLPEARLSHWHSDEDTIYGNLLLPDTIIDYGQSDDSDYGGMLSIGNCEIGKRRISQIPSLFRSICMNGCIWGQVKGKQIRRPHRGKIVLPNLADEIADNINEQLPLLPDGVRLLLRLNEFKVMGVPMKNVFALIASENGMHKAEANEMVVQFVNHEKGDKNLFGIVNAITRAGQTLDPERWVKFDEIGGQFLNMNLTGWEKVLTRAAAMDEKEIEKAFKTVNDE